MKTFSLNLFNNAFATEVMRGKFSHILLTSTVINEFQSVLSEITVFFFFLKRLECYNIVSDILGETLRLRNCNQNSYSFEIDEVIKFLLTFY